MAEQVPSEALHKVEMPALVLNGMTGTADQVIGQLLEVLLNARSTTCEGDHGSTPFQPSFQQAISDFFEEQWLARDVLSVRTQDRASALIADAVAYPREHLEDIPEIRPWVWTP